MLSEREKLVLRLHDAGVDRSVIGLVLNKSKRTTRDIIRNAINSRKKLRGDEFDLLPVKLVNLLADIGIRNPSEARKSILSGDLNCRRYRVGIHTMELLCKALKIDVSKR